MRATLTEAGFDPNASAVGDLFPEDAGDFGVLVTPDRTVFTFVVDCGPRHEERDCSVIEWEKRPDADSRFPYAPAIFAAMTLLEEESPSDIDPLNVLVDYVADRHLPEKPCG